MINPYQSPQAPKADQYKPELLPLSKYVARGAYAGAKWTAIVLAGLSFVAAIIPTAVTLHISYRHNVPLSELWDWNDAIEVVGMAIEGVFSGSILGAMVGSLFGLLNGLRQRRMYRES